MSAFRSNKDRESIIVALAIICFYITYVLGATKGLLSNYSFWADETYSIATIKSTWSEMFEKWIIPDTSPPLYPILIKTLSIAFPIDEVSGRIVSFVLIQIGIAAIVFVSTKIGKAACLGSAAFLISLPIIWIYGQESRNYALLMMLSSIATSTFLLEYSIYPSRSALSGQRLLMHISLVLISTVHYFGLIFAALLTGLGFAIDYTEKTKARGTLILQNILMAMLILAWPIYHFCIAGSLESSYNLYSWHRLEPLWGTISELKTAFFPGLQLANIAILPCAGAAFMIWIRKYVQSSQNLGRLKTLRNPGNLLVMLIFLYVLVIGSIDIAKPLSLARNYIVLAPAISLALGCFLQYLRNRNNYSFYIFLSFIIFLFCVNTAVASDELTQKNRPYDNFKSLAEVIESGKLCDKFVCSVHLPKAIRKVYFPAFKKTNSARANVNRFETNAAIQAPELIISRQESDYPSQNERQKLICYQAEQSWKHGVALYITHGHESDIEPYAKSFKLRPC